MTRSEANARISEILMMYVSARDPQEFDLLPQTVTAGKLYEAYALALVARQLVGKEGLRLMLMNSNYLSLQSSPGRINRRRPYILLQRNGRTIAEMWTDVEFLSLSYGLNPGGTPTKGEYHELDIVIIEPGLSGRPRHDQIWLGVECKNTGYKKNLLKEILGVRRELSLLTDEKPTRFREWPRTSVPCSPASCLLVYASDINVIEYTRPGQTFGIDFQYEELVL
jgi:hypothetical protein